MSKLLDDLIQQKRDDTESYEEFLRKAEQLAMHLVGQSPSNSHPSILNNLPAAIVLFNNLSDIPMTTFQCPEDSEQKAQIALNIDLAMRENAPAGWRGDDTREKQVLNALFPVMNRDREATMAIFEIIKKQQGYA
ncbi:MAG: hypothetical protein KAS23_02880 [Anaerohalosphaera sp.]|nr:hypothetical protein [Anaerohalosphaera sp.]